MKAPSIIACGSLIGVVAGCFLNSSSRPAPEPVQTEQAYATMDSMSPDALPYTTARLTLAGTPVSVQLERESKGEDVVFKLIAKKTLIEEEHYVVRTNSFLFAGLSDETFDPAIPVVRFPFRVGDTWDWEGKAALGTNRKDAKAVITSSPERINLSGGVYDCVVIVADLVVDAGDGAQSKRALKFWIQPKKGIVKREFFYSSTREPRPAGSP